MTFPSAPAGDERLRLQQALSGRAPRSLTSPTPWVLHDHVRLAQGLFIGAAAMLVGWHALAQTVLLSRQTLYFTIALGGLMLSAATVGVWLLAGLRAIRTRRALVQGGVLLLVQLLPTGKTSLLTADQGGELVSTPAMTRFHRGGCLLVEGKDVDAATRSEHLSAGKRPCPVCEP